MARAPRVHPVRTATERGAASFVAWGLALGLALGARAAPAAEAGQALAQATPAARQLMAWVRDSRDHQGLPFIVIDKPQARAYVFSASGALRSAAPVLMGMARGDLSVPGIGERPMASIRPEERTTPAGRFLAEIGRNTQGEDIVWVDYDAAVSLHRVRASNRAERRLERLASSTPADNRISYGCINVPRAFFDRQVLPLLQGAAGRAVVYVLPEVLPLTVVFPRLGQRAGASSAPAA